MASIKSIADKKACSKGTGINTGTNGCQTEFKSPESLLSVDKSFKIPPTAVLSPSYLLPYIQKDIITPLIGASSFERLSSEDTSSTNTSGVERLNLPGLPKYRLTFEEGHEFYKNLSKITGFKNKDFIVIDEDGNWRLAVTSAGDFEGFTAGQVVAEMVNEKVKGGDSESKSLTVQFLNRRQWDLNYSILSAEELGFLPEDIPTINTLNLSFNVNPANTDTVLNISAKLSDRVTLIEGLLAGNFLVKVNGVTQNGVVLAEPTPSNYNLTLGTAVTTGDLIEISTFDAALNTTATVSNGIVYRSTTITAVVV